MSDLPTQAVILAAGRGSRLRPFTDTCPKPLVPLLNVPVLEHLLVALARCGIEQVWINAWHHAALLESRARALAARLPEVRLHVRREHTLLGTGGGLANLWAGMPRAPTLVLTSDVIAPFDVPALVRRHRETDAVATMVLATAASVRRYGAVEIDHEGMLLDIVGLLARDGAAPTGEAAGAHVNGSLHLLSPGFLDRLPSRPSCLVRDGYVPALAEGAPCAAHLHTAPWHETGTPGALLDTQRALLTGRLALDPALVPRVGARHPGDSRVHPTARLAPGVTLRHTVVGARARVGRGARLVDCLVLPDARVPPGSRHAGRVLHPGPMVRAGGGAGGPAGGRAA